MKCVSECFGDDLLTQSSPGIVIILIFRSKAFAVFKVANDDEDDSDRAITTIINKVKSDIENIPSNNHYYDPNMSMDKANESVSETSRALLKRLSPKLVASHSYWLHDNVHPKQSPTSLQTDIGIVIRDSKKLVNLMHAFGVTCSNDGVLRLKNQQHLLL